MATIDIKDVAGKTVKSVELNDAVFGIEPNIHVMHTVVRAYRAGLRQGTANTKTRGEVRGGGKKPWRQKGTGRARQVPSAPSVGWRRHRVRSPHPFLRVPREPQGSQACYALCAFR